ncbi:carbon-nitrogen hydrolase family protein [Schnuerera sp. xch1]|uniref:carbon-nitrogen hydrolase family protein n=1 Tax=Schnuerera sp. xch1 TaxID=2874283 RepID=UPI001CBF7A49|nr:carbon-nitrogen hydrolase family protein [Schnuerera sp. xch1]MBZ2175566.1 carbon-nitrogen hydrolase family protein [Schnuerera sp. xch1]
MKNVKIGIIQMRVVEDKKENIRRAGDYIKEVTKNGADIAVLPEMFNCPYDTENFPKYAEKEGGETYTSLSKLADENNIYLVAGSVPEEDMGRVYNTSFVFDRSGNKIGKHRKMHLFDIDVEGGQYFKESDTLSPGEELNVFDTEFGKFGLAICYDFRFPEVGRIFAQKGAKAIIVPAAFNMTTGPAHWEIMFRSRALDNQVYTIGVAPARDEDSNYISYANSMVVSPWGNIIERMDEKEGYRIVDINFDCIQKVRQELPLLKHRRTDIYSLDLIVK